MGPKFIMCWGVRYALKPQKMNFPLFEGQKRVARLILPSSDADFHLI